MSPLAFRYDKPATSEKRNMPGPMRASSAALISLRGCKAGPSAIKSTMTVEAMPRPIQSVGLGLDDSDSG